jgi:hypothetical protein
MIDATGGSLMSPDGRLEVMIPANALSAATPISIQPVTNEAPGGAGVGFSLAPDRQKFSQPVTLRFHYKPEDLLGTDVNALAIATQKVNHIWYSFKTISLDSVNGTLSASTTHFSPYSLYRSLKISPMQATIKVNTTQKVTVQLVSPATDDDANDELSPLATIIPYPNAEEISWTLNGSKIGTVEDGFITAAGNTSTATYNAPSTTVDMTSNPVAVTAEVDILGPSKQYLTSNIKVTSESGVSGRISLSATISGSKANTFLTTITETKTEEGSGTLVYDLPNVAVDEGGSDRSANWNDAGFGGTANWVSEHVTSYNFICDNVKDRIVTDKETTTQTFSSASPGSQITGVGLTIGADGSYTIAIGPSTSTAATTVTKSEHSGYCINPDTQTSTNQSPIPFAQYFIPFVGGGGQKTTGKIDPAQPNSIKGTYHGTDNITMFSYNLTDITLPLDYTITWDLTLTK